MKIEATKLYKAIIANNDNLKIHSIFLVSSNDMLYQRFPRKKLDKSNFTYARKEMRMILMPLVLTFTLIEK